MIRINIERLKSTNFSCERVQFLFLRQFSGCRFGQFVYAVQQ